MAVGLFFQWLETQVPSDLKYPFTQVVLEKDVFSLGAEVRGLYMDVLML